MANVDITLQQLYDMIKGGAVGVPVGTIVDYYGTTAPNGWLICDGREVPTTMSQLRNLIGSKTPDLRGRFRRMIGGNAADIAVAQGDAIRNIEGHLRRLYAEIDVVNNDHIDISGAFDVDIDAETKYTGAEWTKNAYRGGFIFDASRVVPTANENRPVNMAFNAIIYGGG